MLATRHCAKESVTDNMPRRTLMLFGLSPVIGPETGGAKDPNNAFLHCYPDRLLLPVTSECFTTSGDLSTHELTSAARMTDA